MRALFILAALLSGSANASAPPTPAGNINSYLASWEERMAGVTSLSTVLTRVDTDKLFKTSTKSTGWAAYRKSGIGLASLEKAALELKLDGKKEASEKIVFTGTHLYQHISSRKEIYEYEVRNGELAVPAIWRLWFGKKRWTAPVSWTLVVGMKAADAKERFELTLAKEHDNYIYVDVVPKKAEDKTEFQRARLVLDRKTFLPRQVWLEQPNGNEVLWDMPRGGAGVGLNPRTFDKPKEEPGWKIVPVKAAPVIRPASP